MLIKKALYKTLGTKNYLLVTSRIFLNLYASGWLKRYHQFDCHYYVKNLIKEGDEIIDIGANLGYYSVIFSKLTGTNGKVHCIEPIGLFRKILEKNTMNLDNTRIYPYALGDEEGAEVRMGIPKGEKHFRHGLMRVIEGNDISGYEHVSVAEMRKPEKLFEHLEKCDYIKCDVEGYEMHIIPRLLPLFKKFRPILQVETSGENKDKLMDLLKDLQYRAFYVHEGKLADISAEGEFGAGDIFFMSSDNDSN